MTKKKASNSVEVKVYICPEIQNDNLHISPAMDIFKHYDQFPSIANKLFSLPWNYPKKWTVPLN